LKTDKVLALESSDLQKDTVCLKVSHANLIGKHSFVVPEGWETLVLQDGQLGNTFKRGSHKLSPILKDKKQTQLIFYPTLSEIAMLWGTAQKMSFKDEFSSLPIEMGANGSLNFKIKNIRKFYFSFGSFESELKLSQIKETLAPIVISYLHKAITDFSKEQKQSFLTLNFQKAIDVASVDLNYLLQNKFGISLSLITIKGVIFDKFQLRKLEQEYEMRKQQNTNLINEITQKQQDLIKEELEKPQVVESEVETNELQNNDLVPQQQENIYRNLENENEQSEEGLMLLS
jgi:hypothetical protein